MQNHLDNTIFYKKVGFKMFILGEFFIKIAKKPNAIKCVFNMQVMTKTHQHNIADGQHK